VANSASWRDALTRAEIESLLEMNDWRSWFSIALNWGIVFGSMALVAAFPHVLTILLALFLIGARQLGFAVLMHEASHRSLFRSRALNDWAGNWLCAFPIWADLRPYRPYHLQHHAKNWTPDDPDLALATKHPVSRASMARKVWRDLSGQVGWKRLRALVRRDVIGAGDMRTARASAGWKNLQGVVITNALLLGISTVAGHPALYLLWIGAWMTTNSLVTRIRAIAEHSMIGDRDDELQNTRTTIASPLERLFIAPNRVNYHLEHHLLMTVPHYNLPRMHELLRERGLFEKALVDKGYWGVLDRASSSPA
jgi:fatty acid desaturase